MPKKKLVMLTAYDYPTAKILDDVGVDYILVGDSLGMVVLGYQDTKSVTLQDMLHHVRAVSRGVTRTAVVADMPINTYNTPADAVRNARQLLASGAQIVKIEGRKESVIIALLQEKIPVIGHVGLLPQTADTYTVQGKGLAAAEKIYEDAVVLDTLGITALILECVPQSLAARITKKIKTPTIGIGAGVHCDGQVLVLHDVIGLSDFNGKFVRQYAQVKEQIRQAVLHFIQDVRSQAFPTEKESFL